MALRPEADQRQISKQVRAESDPIRRALQENEDWYQDLVKHSQDLLCIHDLDGRLLSVNPAPARILGYSVEEVLQIPMRDLIVPEFRGEFDAYLKQIAERGEAHGLLAVMARSGEHRLWEYHNTLRTEGVASPIVRGMAHDVTEQRNAEKQLREINEAQLAKALERERIIAELKLFRALVDQSNDAIYVVDPDTLRFLDVNWRICSELGYSREDLLSMGVRDINPVVTEASIAQILDELHKSGSLVFETLHRRKDGITFPVEVSIKRVQMNRAYIIVVSRDLSERQMSEARLRESQERYRAVHDQSPVGICWIESRTGRLLGVNPKYCEILGRTEQDLLTRDFQSLTHPDDLPENLKKLRQLIDGELRHYELEKRYLRPDGSVRWADTKVAAMWPEGGDPVWHMVIVQDITDRKRAEQSLRRSEENYRMFISQSSEGIFRQDMDAPVPIDLPEDEMVQHILHDSYMAECNNALARMYGLTSGQEFVGKRLTEMVVPDDPHNIELTRHFIRSGFRVFERESHEVDVHGNSKVFINSMIGAVENGMLVRTWGIQRDVTEKKKLEEARQRAEDALRRSEAHFRLLVEQASDGIFIADPEGRYLDVNSAGSEMLGYSREEVLQLSTADVIVPDEVPRIEPERSRFAGGNVTRTEWTMRRKDGSLFPGEIVARRLPDGRLQGILRDITERRRAEEALRRNEQRFRIALAGSPIWVFNQDLDLRYTWVYNVPQGWTEEDYIGRTDEQVYGPKAGAQIAALKRPVLETGRGTRQEFSLNVRGKTHYCDIMVEPLLDATGRVSGVNCACVDITHIRRITEELRLAKEKLAEEKLYLEHAIDTELGFGEIIGRSGALREVMRKVDKVAPSEATVLLLGETGTGKELVARALHQRSNRKDGSFIKLNCAAIPSGLLESELFGHEKGAFTGAVARKLGRLELADLGTLFLDEIGEIPLSLQPKLLRVLQDHEFERLGGTQTLKVNFRLLAATNRDLLASVNQKEFRSDLYYRLNVFPIRIPPLRDRREDVPLLVEHFVRKYAARMGKSITSISAKTMEALVQWMWPGNIRELENFVERSVILTPGSVLQAPLVELHVEAKPKEEKTATLREKERDRILAVLRACGGQLGGPNGAAARLGMKRTTLQSKLSQLGINPKDFRG